MGCLAQLLSDELMFLPSSTFGQHKHRKLWVRYALFKTLHCIEERKTRIKLYFRHEMIQQLEL
jgi:hypothetical protein